MQPKTTLDFLLKDTDFKKQVSWDNKTKNPQNLTARYTNHNQSDISVLSFVETPTSNLKSKISAHTIHRTRNLTNKLISEQRATDLIVTALYNEPTLVHIIKTQPITSALNQIQNSIFQHQGIQTDLISAYIASEKQLHLIHNLLAFVAKGVIQPYTAKSIKSNNSNKTSLKSNGIKSNNSSRNHSANIIYLISSKEVTQPSYHKISKFSGVYNSKPAITHFRPEAINSLSKFLKTTSNILSKRNVSGMSSPDQDAYEQLIDDYGAEDWGRNDTNNNVVMGDQVENEELIENLTDEEIAANLRDGIFSRAFVKAHTPENRLKSISRHLRTMSNL